MAGKYLPLTLLIIFIATIARGQNNSKNRIKDNQRQITCPVMGADIDQKIYVDYQGQRIYFCCAGCIDTFQENPDKYMAQLAQTREMGNKGLNQNKPGESEKSSSREKHEKNIQKHEGEKKELRQQRESHTNNAHKHGFARKKRYRGKGPLKPQQSCPVMGGPINKQYYVDHQDLRVYFCCQGCITSFKRTPNLYLKTLKRYGEKPIKTP